MQSIRYSKKARLWIIGGLIALACLAFYFAKATWAKVVIGAMIALLVAAFGMEVTNHDYDVKKLAETKSFAASKIERDDKGNLINIDSFCKSEKIDYNCKDFKNQVEAMEVYNRCASSGKNMDAFGLDRDRDGKVCESLPVK